MMENAMDRERLARDWAPTLHRQVMPVQESLPIEIEAAEELPAPPVDDAGTEVPLEVQPAPTEPTPAPEVAPATMYPAPQTIIYNGLPPYTAASSTMTVSELNGGPGANLMMGLPTQEARSSAPEANAFVTDIAGKTIVTAPATTWEKALSPNPHFLWMQGRFVGAEEANRNGAFWSAGDLQLGQSTVQHGPLNWLHEARHVIGTIADARYNAGNVGGAEQAAATTNPHITAAAAIWRWIYPDEAWVVEQASDAQKLWYSMECISDQVACVGDGSCGTEVSYASYMQGLGCQHMAERSATRRFKDPTFLGGAVVVPPARPGWADADATTMAQAATLAERAYDQAGQPDVPASEWEQLMAQIVKYARG